MVKSVSKEDTILPVKKDAMIVPKPTEFMLCNKMIEITMDESVNNKSIYTFNFPKSFLKRMASAPIKPSYGMTVRFE